MCGIHNWRCRKWRNVAKHFWVECSMRTKRRYVTKKGPIRTLKRLYKYRTLQSHHHSEITNQIKQTCSNSWVHRVRRFRKKFLTNFFPADNFHLRHPRIRRRQAEPTSVRRTRSGWSRFALCRQHQLAVRRQKLQRISGRLRCRQSRSLSLLRLPLLLLNDGNIARHHCTIRITNRNKSK